METSDNYHQQFTDDCYAQIAAARSYADVVEVALTQLRLMQAVITDDQAGLVTGVGSVCGPISTGGAGSIEANIERFAQTVDRFRRQRNGLFFGQVEFEEKLWEFKAIDEDTYDKSTANQNLLDAFYVPIFESGLINEFHFLPDWQTSHGARWEREQAGRLGIEVFDIPLEDVV